MEIASTMESGSLSDTVGVRVTPPAEERSNTCVYEDSACLSGEVAACASQHDEPDRFAADVSIEATGGSTWESASCLQLRNPMRL